VAAGFNHGRHLQSLYEGLEEQCESSAAHRSAARGLEALWGERLPGRPTPSRAFRAPRVRQMVADAVAVRWSDEASQRYLMLASDFSAGGGRRAQPAGRGLRLRLQPTRHPVIPIHTHDAAPMPLRARGPEPSAPVRLQAAIGRRSVLSQRGSAQRQESGLRTRWQPPASSLGGCAAALEREARWASAR
jgi:two-component system nitrate/nitrite sensor histidine kinase NarX